MKHINFYDYNILAKLQDKRLLKEFINYLFQKEKKQYATIDIIFCSDKYLLTLNKKFLNHSYYTDTMTFVLNHRPIIGEIYISVDRVRENSQKLTIKYQDELIRVIIHSCLHLCGYKDKIKADKIKMIKLQENYVKQWLVSRETQIGG